AGPVTEDPRGSTGRGRLARAGTDGPGFVTFGPYRLLPPGDYRARFRLKGIGAGMELQVTTRGGREILGRVTVHLADGAFVEIPVPFTVRTPAPIEYRAGWDGQGWVAVDWVAANFASESDPAQIFEVGVARRELEERAAPAASGGVAGYAAPGRTARDAVWTGPLRRYPPGRYELWIRLKLDHPVAGAFARCAAQLASRGGELSGREL